MTDKITELLEERRQALGVEVISLMHYQNRITIFLHSAGHPRPGHGLGATYPEAEAAALADLKRQTQGSE